MASITSKGLMWGGAIALAAYWSSHYVALSAGEQYAALRARSVPAYLVNGYVPDLDAFTTRFDKDGIVPRRGQCRVVFMLSDTCPGCRIELPMWNRVISATRGHDIHYAFVALSGRELIDEIVKGAGLASHQYDVRQVTSSASFVVQTGLVASPMTLLLDGDGVARAVARNLDDATYDELVKAVKECVPSAST